MPKGLPAEHQEWNRRHNVTVTGAGLTGHGTPVAVGNRRLRALGSYAFQKNSTTRFAEYPWSATAAGSIDGLNVVEIGGALSGFQFSLAREGALVTNVDPFLDYGSVDRHAEEPEAAHARLCRAFANVNLLRCTLDEADLRPASVDVYYCVSTLEHIPDEQLASIINAVRRTLRPGGKFVVTADLFLNLKPFTLRERNQWGRNLDIKRFVDATGMTLAVGKPAELYGYPEFHPERVQSRLEEFNLNAYYPVLAQALVLEN